MKVSQNHKKGGESLHIKLDRGERITLAAMPVETHADMLRGWLGNEGYGIFVAEGLPVKYNVAVRPEMCVVGIGAEFIEEPTFTPADVLSIQHVWAQPAEDASTPWVKRIAKEGEAWLEHVYERRGRDEYAFRVRELARRAIERDPETEDDVMDSVREVVDEWLDGDALRAAFAIAFSNEPNQVAHARDAVEEVKGAKEALRELAKWGLYNEVATSVSAAVRRTAPVAVTQ